MPKIHFTGINTHPKTSEPWRSHAPHSPLPPGEGTRSCSRGEAHAFRSASARGIGRGGRRMQLIHTGFAGPDHPILPQLAETGYLKALFFRLDG